MVRSVGQRPAIFSFLAVCYYLLLILPIAASRDFDWSVFVLAGDRYVDHAKLATPLRSTHSYSYDGQFFYRLATNPFSVEPSAGGVTFDSPAKRMQRILYPTLAWLVSLGRAQWAPASLVLVNLAGLGALAASSAWLTRKYQLSWWFPFLIVGWPGFLIALTHDTAEIVAAAFCMAALACYMSDRLAAYGISVAAATLTRETVIPIFLGPLLYEAWRLATSPSSSGLRRTALCGLALVPFAIWHVVVGALWSETAQPLVGNSDLGWPLVGVAQMLFVQFAGGYDTESGAPAMPGHRIFVATTAIGLIGFCVAVATRLRRVAGVPGATGVAIGWGLDLLLMSLLAATGPWAGPQAYFRAFTECWIVGALLLSISRPAPAPKNPIRLFATLAAVEVILLVWKLCYALLPR